MKPRAPALAEPHSIVLLAQPGEGRLAEYDANMVRPLL
jgi:hypothetical protein